MPNADQLSRMITPGSTQYGDRQALAAGAPSSGAGAAPAAPPVTPLPSDADPLGMMLGGQLRPDNEPITAGLSVGPGGGPVPQQLPDAMSERLLYLAQNAQTPMLRYMARQALRSRFLARGA